MWIEKAKTQHSHYIFRLISLYKEGEHVTLECSLFVYDSQLYKYSAVSRRLDELTENASHAGRCSLPWGLNPPVRKPSVSINEDE